jgi:hypothetical protein
MDEVQLQESNEGWIITLVNLEVTQIQTGWGLFIFCERSDDAYLLIEILGTFNLFTEENEIKINPFDELPAVRPAFDILHLKIASLNIRLTGSLEILFSDGNTIIIPYDDEDSAWEIITPELRIVTQPHWKGSNVEIFHLQQ